MIYAPMRPIISKLMAYHWGGGQVVVTWLVEHPGEYAGRIREARRSFLFPDEPSAKAAVEIFRELGENVVLYDLWDTVRMEATL